MTFAWPWILLALPLPWLLGRRGATGAREGARQGPRAVRLPPSVTEALDGTGRQGRRVPNLPQALLWLGWLALLLALARPSSPGDTVVQPASGRTLVLVVDLSDSMRREDFTLDGVASDRLSVVKRVAGDFVERRRGDRIGLVLFGKEAFVASAPTFDLAALRAILDGADIGMAGRSTAIGDALGLALQTLRSDPAPERAIVLLSDGTNNAGSVEPESAASLAATLGVRVHAIALASDEPTRGGLRTAVAADLDEATLEAIGERSGGRFFRARTTADLVAVYREIDRLERVETPAPPVILARDHRQVPELALLGSLLALALLRRRRA